MIGCLTGPRRAAHSALMDFLLGHPSRGIPNACKGALQRAFGTI
jgi:hypothetical protein